MCFFVNKSDEVNAIMALGDNGIPAQAYSIDNVTDGSFSTTEADKQKKYQVYLEDKLKDHLEKQSYVNEASVDITMPDKDGTILKSKEEATAAVTLGLKDSITDDQAYAIARLVATALGNDTTKGITIIDKKANVLYSGGDSDTSAGLATSQLSYKQKLEEQVKNEVKKTLESSNIFSNIEVGMNLDIDFSKTETAQKNYTLPDGQTDTGLLDSESNYQSDATNGQAAVPGTDSNSDDTTYTTQDGTPSESSITDNDKKYLNDEKITTSKNDGGSIKYDSSSITVVATRYKVYDERYASLRIRGAILDQIRKMDWIPRTVRQRQRKIDEAIKNIELRTGKTANDADLAKELSISEDELCSWQSQLKVTNVVSLDEFDESGPEPVMDAAHNSHYAQPEEIVTQEELKTMLVKSLDNLTEKERRVIELYYYEDLTLKEISNILEVSESRVSQLHTKGLIKMRKVMGPYMNILTNA